MPKLNLKNPEVEKYITDVACYWIKMCIRDRYNFDQVGEKDMYLLHHEEIESLAKNIPGIKRIRFFMTFGQS